MMTQLHPTIWRCWLTATVVLTWFSLPLTLAHADNQINVICDDQSCATDAGVSDELWAPGSLLQRKIEIQNQSVSARSITATVVLNKGQESATSLVASWRNGSRHLLWQGSLAQSAKQIPLGQVPAKNSRIYWLDVSLPKTIDNTLQRTSISFEPFITLTEVAPKPTTAKASKATTNKLTPPSVLGQAAHHFSFLLPDLHRLSSPIKNPESVKQIVWATRNQWWWGWLILTVEMAILWQWRHDHRGWVWLSWIGLLSVVLTWITSGWLLSGLAGLMVGVVAVTTTMLSKKQGLVLTEHHL